MSWTPRETRWPSTTHWRRTTTVPTGATSNVAYHRGGYLTRIDYGMRSDSIYTKPAPAQVVFTAGDRCLSAATTCTANHTATDWPDVPWDRNCASGTAACAVTGPTFWTTKRLSAITAQVLTNPAAVPPTYGAADTYTLTHQFPNPNDGTTAALWLASVQRTGKDGTAIALPATTFQGQALANRVDSTSSWPPLVRYRIGAITSETGQTTGVTYSAADCTPTSLPSSPETNTRRCFPAYWTPPGQPDPVRNWFHKYVVTQITEQDGVGGAPPKTTAYNYVGNPAWHFDDTELVKTQHRTYGQWRGYARVQVRTGAAS